MTRRGTSRRIVAVGASVAFHIAVAVLLGLAGRRVIATDRGARAGAGGPPSMLVSLIRMPAPINPPPPAPPAASPVGLKARLTALDPVAPALPIAGMPQSSIRPAAPIGQAQREQAGASAATPPGAPGGATTGLALDFQREVQIHIAQFKRFPADAGTGPIHGVVRVVFSINRAGQVLALAVRQSSGDPRLDAEALATIWRAQPMPQIPPPLPDEVGFIVPIDFSTAGE
jgi:protein TonB